MAKMLKLHNFVTGHDTSIYDGDLGEHAREYIPQEPEAQNLYELLRYTGMTVGLAMVRVLEASLAAFPSMPSFELTASDGARNG